MRNRRTIHVRRVATGLAVALTCTALAAGPSASAQEAEPGPTLEGPIPASVPGDPSAPDVGDTAPFYATWIDLAAVGYVEEEYYVTGAADAYSTAGALLAEDVPYRTRMIVRRPASDADFSGTVLAEWQNVTAGWDLDALWSARHVRDGHVWVGISAQRVGVDFLTQWSPARYGDLDVTGDGQFVTDQLSYDIFAQAAAALRAPSGADPLAGLGVERVLAIGASQSATRMTTYYNTVLPQSTPVFDGYGFIVGSAPSRVGTEPIFHVLSETDVTSPLGRRADSDVYRRWEVAGAAHSGWEGQEYRFPLNERDLGGNTDYQCANPPFSRVALGNVISAAYDHLAHWVSDGTAPPSAPYLQFSGLTKVRNELGLALGGIQLPEMVVPTALNSGSNSGPSFCFLFGTHRPFDDALLATLYPTHEGYVEAVVAATNDALVAGYLLEADAAVIVEAAERSAIGRLDERTQRLDVGLDAAAGALVVSVDPNDRQVQMSPLELSTSADRWTSSGELRPVHVSDSRPGRPGWNVSGQVGAFVSAVDDFGAQHLGWSPTVTSQAPGQMVQPGPVVDTSDVPGQGMATSRTLASAGAGAGRGTARLGAALGLDLPAHLGEPGTYSALLTITAI